MHALPEGSYHVIVWSTGLQYSTVVVAYFLLLYGYTVPQQETEMDVVVPKMQLPNLAIL